MRRLVFICLPALCWGAFFTPTVQGAEPTALEVRVALHKAAASSGANYLLIML